jgi:hypothetical protein
MDGNINSFSYEKIAMNLNSMIQFWMYQLSCDMFNRSLSI